MLIFGADETYSEAEVDHDRNLETALRRTRAVGLRFNARKFVYKAPPVSYCGHLVAAKGLQPDLQKVQAITTTPAPTNRKGIPQLLGITNY